MNEYPFMTQISPLTLHTYDFTVSCLMHELIQRRGSLKSSSKTKQDDIDPLSHTIVLSSCSKGRNSEGQKQACWADRENDSLTVIG